MGKESLLSEPEVNELVELANEMSPAGAGKFYTFIGNFEKKLDVGYRKMSLANSQEVMEREKDKASR